MRKVQCHECGKRYDFDVDDFCPKCGAFTQPSRSVKIGIDGAVIRADGINEQNHKNSFVHAELHQENRKRKGTFLEGIPAALKSGAQLGERLTGHPLSKSAKKSNILPDITDLLNDILG